MNTYNIFFRVIFQKNPPRWIDTDKNYIDKYISYGEVLYHYDKILVQDFHTQTWKGLAFLLFFICSCLQMVGCHFPPQSVAENKSQPFFLFLTCAYQFPENICRWGKEIPTKFCLLAHQVTGKSDYKRFLIYDYFSLKVDCRLIFLDLRKIQTVISVSNVYFNAKKTR